MKKKTLIILALVMMINALSYGTIIPLLYPYAARFGINPLGLSMLFASFSLFQFLATPVIGSLSDRYGRKPLLLISLFGTCLSLAFFASAQALWQLFLARILDGVTGGNMSVAQAVIADSVEGKKRARAFGMLGASFGFGFLIGPALGGFLSEYSLTLPFWFASGLALLGTLLGFFFLDETNPKHKRSELSSSFTMLNPLRMADALKKPVVGMLLVLTIIISLAGNAFIIGFQSFTVDILKLSPREIGILFTLAGFVSLLTQAGGIKLAEKFVPSKERLLKYLLALAVVALLALAFASTLPIFTLVLIFFMLPNSAMAPVLSGIISESAPDKEQGKILGISQSFTSFGQILGPIMAGLVATFYVPGIFGLSSLLMLVALVILVKKIVPSATSR
ncbi:MAG: MFS transporter [bacterium]|nr:MFS transporter [bacterium]